MEMAGAARRRVTAVLVDLAPDGARRLDARTALGLLRGGVSRARARPRRARVPGLPGVDLRVPAQYRDGRARTSSTGPPAPNLTGRLWSRFHDLQRGAAGFPRSSCCGGRRWRSRSPRRCRWFVPRPSSAPAAAPVVARRATSRAPSAVRLASTTARADHGRTRRARAVILLAVGAVAWSAAASPSTRLASVSCGPACASCRGARGTRTCSITAPLTAAAAVWSRRRGRRRTPVATPVVAAPAQPARRLSASHRTPAPPWCSGWS